jgi:4-amino-4-deoxy-L-arabinose transferase-like glycosyltransferase
VKKILLIIFIVLAYLNYRFLELGFLQNYSVDGYAFHGSLLNMFEGIMSLDIKKFFTFNFYSYGFGFFALNLFATFPFILMENWEMTIYIPRIIVSIFAISSIYLIFKISRDYLDKFSSILLSLIAISMPGFWINTFFFRPNWMMTFFIILTIYYLTKDSWKNEKYLWRGSISFGLAIATKIQAITFIPLIFLYIFYDNLQNKSNLNFFRKSKLFIKTLFLSFSVFVLTNPYIIHPIGFKAFTESFLGNLRANSTNHGSDISYSITEKINNAIDPFYFDKYVFIIFILISLFLSLKILKKKIVKIFSILLLFTFF